MDEDTQVEEAAPEPVQSEAVADDAAHDEWLARVKQDEEDEAAAQAKRDAQAAHEAEVHEQELAAQQASIPADEPEAEAAPEAVEE